MVIIIKLIAPYHLIDGRSVRLQVYYAWLSYLALNQSCGLIDIIGIKILFFVYLFYVEET